MMPEEDRTDEGEKDEESFDVAALEQEQKWPRGEDETGGEDRGGAGGEPAGVEESGEEGGWDDAEEEREGEVDGQAEMSEMEQAVVEDGGWGGIGESLRAGEEAQLVEIGEDAVVVGEIGEAIVPVHPHAAVFIAADSPDEEGHNPGEGGEKNGEEAEAVELCG